MIHFKTLSLTFVCLVTLSFNLRATPPSLESIEPAVGSMGTEFSVLATGSGFDKFKSVLFYDSGIELLRHEVLSNNELNLWFKSQANATPGRYYFRIATTDGSSELRALTLTPYPLLTEQRETQDAIQKVERNTQRPNVTLLGVLEEGDRDRYTALYSKGERVSIEVEAVRLGYVLLDTILTVYDPSGNVVTTIDDTPLYKQDPFVTFVAEVGGEYTIEVRETAYEGDSRSRYAIHIGNFARPSFVFPLGGPIGEKIELSIEGDYASAPAIPLVPQADWLRKGFFLNEREISSPTSIPFRAVAFGNVIEREPNDTPELPGDTPESLQPVELPVAFNGLIERPGDMDCFAFRAEAGKVYVLEAFADRVGSLADTLITILDQRGRILVRNDDGNTHDSRLEFRAPQTDTYFLHVTDKLANGDWRFVYRVEATERLPMVTGFVPRPIRRTQEGQTFQVPQGNRALLKFGAQRVYFDGAVQGELKNLPVGVRNSSILLESNRYWVPVVVTAEDNAEIGGTLVDASVMTPVAATPQCDGGFSQIVDLIDGPADAIYHQADLNRLAMSVTRRVPFKVDLQPPTTSLPLDGSLDLIVKVTRDPGFAGPIEVFIPVLPPDTYAEAKIEIPADKSEATYTIYSLPVTPERSWALCCEAQAGAKARADARADARGQMDRGDRETPAPDVPSADSAIRVTETATNPMSGSDLSNVKVCSDIAELKIAPSPIAGSLQQTAGEQGTTIQVLCQLSWNTEAQLPEELSLTLEDLPNRVKADPVVWKGEKEIRIPLHLDPTAPIGTFDSVYARMAGIMNGQRVSFNIGRGAKLVIAPPGKLMRNEAGEALSPLDALRRSQQK
jgi:hypothetical protein